MVVVDMGCDHPPEPSGITSDENRERKADPVWSVGSSLAHGCGSSLLPRSDPPLGHDPHGQ